MAIGAEIPFGWSVRSRRAIDDRFITADLTTRDALSTFRRHKNLEVFVESTNRSYYLDNDTTNSDWMEVLKSIDVLTEDSAITDDDFLVWFDENLKTHKKIKKSDFGGSKWTEVANGIYRNGRVAIGTTTVTTTDAFVVRQLTSGTNIVNFLNAAGSARLTLTDFVLSVAGGGSNFDWRDTPRTSGVGIGIILQVKGSGNEFISEFTHAGSTAVITFGSLPTSDPLISGRVWRSGNDLKISTG
jgi:hypothetical protein